MIAPAANKPIDKKRGKSFPLLMTGAVVAAATIGVLAYVFLFRHGDVEVVQDVKPKHGVVKGRAPYIVTNATRKVEEVRPESTVVRWQGKEYPRFNEKGGEAVVTRYGVKYLTPTVITNRGANAEMRIPWEAKQFKHSTDKTIAVLLCTEPGTQFVGGYSYDGGFTEKFLKSLEEPIEVYDDDSEDVRELKQLVAETRRDLKERHDNGEDIAKIIYDTHEEFRQLGAYKADLERQVQSVIRDKTLSEKDLDDLVGAANLMLRERGCSELKMPAFIRRGIQLRAARAAARQESDNQGETK